MSEDPKASPSTRRPTVSWDGRYLEDFVVGDVYRHPLGRTVLATDNSWLTLLTQNTAAVHFDAHYAARTQWGRPLVDSTFTLALVTGQSVHDVSMNVMANLGWDRVRLPNPVFEGDTIYSESEVLSARASASRSDVGVVEVRTIGFNQDGVIVISFERTLLVYRRGHGPGRGTVEPRWDARTLRAAGLVVSAPPE
ncbi:MaoC family dehydratase [Frankia gtarii]|uniref:MaoC family dehydratase n=1 Tax=Frankia gtarii TaxID=2950102 RepID=UPI0021C1E73A|nr:MaoC family dehydratase [Frankia gtarii]